MNDDKQQRCIRAASKAARKRRPGAYTAVRRGASDEATPLPVPNSPLRIVALGGLETEIGINCMAYEYGDDLILVDAGLMFPDADMPGVDYLDTLTFLVAGARHKLRGILLTHGHEDHIGALPFLLHVNFRPRSTALP